MDTETAFRTKEDSPTGQEIQELIEYGCLTAKTRNLDNAILSRCGGWGGPTPTTPVIDDPDILLGLCKPMLPITPEASAVHGITNADVDGFPSFEVLMPPIAAKIKNKVVVIHNAAFDWSVLTAHADKVGLTLEPLVVLDTLPVFMKLFPERRQHKLTVLKYALGLPKMTAHRALQDAGTLAMVFNAAVAKFLADGGDDDLRVFLKIVVDASAEPLDVMPLGKHKGMKLLDVPTDYLTWWFSKAPDPSREPFHQADYSFALELRRRGSWNITEEKVEKYRMACASKITWPHLLP